jgi:hypothetical protein
MWSEPEPVAALDQARFSSETDLHDRSDEAADVAPCTATGKRHASPEDLVQPAEPEPRYEPTASDEDHGQTTT